jgi:hypothetical protein
MRAVFIPLLALTSCFGVPAFEDGELLCDQGRCPPGMSCENDGRCYASAPVATADAPITTTLDASPGAADATASDASPPRPDAPLPDAAPPCPTGMRRCVAGNVEICIAEVWVASSPSCAQQGLDCWDPAPSGGSDAYCGECLNGGQRCASDQRQTCSAGAWGDTQDCSAFGCYDPDGADGAMSYCGVCANGTLRCDGELETCAAGQWPSGVDCSATSGWSCFDPAPAGGTDAYCGLCLKDAFECHGNSRDRCNSQGTAFNVVESCTWGCLASTAACCAAPSCGTRECGPSPMNACGRQIGCGSCPPNFICIVGTCESNQ